MPFRCADASRASSRLPSNEYHFKIVRCAIRDVVIGLSDSPRIQSSFQSGTPLGFVQLHTLDAMRLRMCNVDCLGARTPHRKPAWSALHSEIMEISLC
ncbi:hypothetical protein BVI1335_1650007 [Burkholderia vietnamiensis]|nr:hypothetical protein BVI1335_1650007 [Burkholderia vietnamiensis]